MATMKVMLAALPVARPLIARKVVEVAEKENAVALLLMVVPVRVTIS